MSKLRSLIPLLALVAAVSACTDANQSATSQRSGEAVGQAATCSYPLDGEPVRPVDPPQEHNVPNKGSTEAVLHMSAGDVTLTLDQGKAPCTTNSFLSLAQQGYFDDTKCHRLVDHGIFILQCGDPSATGKGGPGYTFADEIAKGTTYPRGTVAMANRGPDTNGSQFFLVWDDSPLDPNYTVFGSIDEAGLDVIGQIAAQGVAAEDQMSPIAEAKITTVTVG